MWATYGLITLAAEILLFCISWTLEVKVIAFIASKTTAYIIDKKHLAVQKSKFWVQQAALKHVRQQSYSILR